MYVAKSICSLLLHHAIIRLAVARRQICVVLCCVVARGTCEISINFIAHGITQLYCISIKLYKVLCKLHMLKNQKDFELITAIIKLASHPEVLKKESAHKYLYYTFILTHVLHKKYSS